MPFSEIIFSSISFTLDLIFTIFLELKALYEDNDDK